MQNELDVVRDLSEKLGELGIPFMLTGSLAMNYYTTPRMTRDIDMVMALEPADVEKLVGCLAPTYYVSLERARDAAASRTMFNVIHQESVIKVDFIVRKDSEYRRVEFDRRLEVEIAGFRTCLVSKEDLILSKLVWAKGTRSELQFRDVRNLLATGYDDEYVERWAQALGVEQLLDELRDA
jgi:hypothetical protein